jgi:FSR family fosmidomycin resistance protein-like MFS transporter
MRSLGIIVGMLAIEFLDELVFGAREASWPLVRGDLALSYVQIGLLLGVPGFVSNVIEPAMGLAADVWNRRRMIVIGGIVMAGSIGMMAMASSFWPLMIAFLIMYPASGAFVSLSQASLMDMQPQRREQNMARWALAGSVGAFVGPVAVTVIAAAAVGWRPLFAGLAVLTLVVALATRKGSGNHPPQAPGSFREVLGGAVRLLRSGTVVRWLLLLQFADLMLDVLFGYLALYFVDVAGAGPAVAGAAVAIWTGVGLGGDFLLVLLLERIKGVAYLRVSAALVLLLFPAFLLVPNLVVKLALLGMLGFLNAGWYSILQARLYASVPGKSGTALALGNVANLLGALMLVGLGASADAFGLAPTMWLLVLGPVALVVGLWGRGVQLDEPKEAQGE